MNALNQASTGGITVIDLAIVFAVLSVVGIPSFETGLTVVAAALVGLLAFVVVVMVFVIVRVVLPSRRHQEERT